ncbi:hypothetical protein B0H14DRAFT_3694112 [Mycena olivaceomarginata]|nr:hypothetical protein B0H14DRAFT_3694112 [Mycena olivaceomarginata]
MSQSTSTAWPPARTHRTRESALIPAAPQTVFPHSATRTTIGRSEILFCGSEQRFITESFNAPRPTPFCPGNPAAEQRPQMLRRSSGCGAQVHSRASPEFDLWTGFAQRQAYTVIPLDAQYVPSEAAALLACPGRQGCACSNEFVGCAVCGNHLGARLTLCATHVLSLGPGTSTFLPSSVSPPHPSPDNTILPATTRLSLLAAYANQNGLELFASPSAPRRYIYADENADADETETETPWAPPPLPSLHLARPPPSTARAPPTPTPLAPDDPRRYLALDDHRRLHGESETGTGSAPSPMLPSLSLDLPSAPPAPPTPLSPEDARRYLARAAYDDYMRMR